MSVKSRRIALLLSPVLSSMTTADQPWIKVVDTHPNSPIGTIGLAGSATGENPIHVVGDLPEISGGVWVDVGAAAKLGFRIRTTWRVVNTHCCWWDGGGDGFAFAVQGEGMNVASGAGHTVGLASVDRGFAVMVRRYFGTEVVGCGEGSFSFASYCPGFHQIAAPDIADSTMQAWELRMRDGRLDLLRDDAMLTSWKVDEQSLTGDLKTAYVGITAANGGSIGVYDLHRFEVWVLDCNGNLIPDSEDIAAGTLPDVNNNGVPDACELQDCDHDGILDSDAIAAGAPDQDRNGIPDSCECLGDVTHNGTVDGTDLAAILGSWGTLGNGEFATDRNADGTVNGLDLAIVLGGWGACGN